MLEKKVVNLYFISRASTFFHYISNISYRKTAAELDVIDEFNERKYNFPFVKRWIENLS